MKLHFETLFEILIPSELNCTHRILISVPALYSNRLINYRYIFYYLCEGKIPKINRLNHCMKLD